MTMKTETNYYYLFPEYVGVFKTEKPEDAAYYNLRATGLSYAMVIMNWMRECTKYKFADGEKDKFIALVGKNPPWVGTDAFVTTLKSGILLPSERVKIEEVYSHIEPITALGEVVGGEKIYKSFAYFVPIEDKPKYPIGGYAPGNYSCTCCICKTEFTGDKRAVQCEPCAIKMVEDKPIEETQDKMWYEVINDPIVYDHTITIDKYISTLKSKFTLTRK